MGRGGVGDNYVAAAAHRGHAEDVCRLEQAEHDGGHRDDPGDLNDDGHDVRREERAVRARHEEATVVPRIRI